MLTVLGIGPFRFFYSYEDNEPAHIHVQRDNILVKFGMKPIGLSSSTRFSPSELRKYHRRYL